jgi:hypothetical protein
MANSDLESADAKNRAIRDAGFVVLNTFEELPRVLKETYEDLVRGGTIVPKREVKPPVIPMDYKWAQELGLIRKPAAFISTISDERGQELLYAGMKISEVFREDIGLGGVVALLWFKRRMCFFFYVSCRSFTYRDSFDRSPSLGYQVRRDGSHAHCRPRSRRVWCHEHHHHHSCR